MAKATSWEVFLTLNNHETYPVQAVDSLNNYVFFQTPIYEPGLRSLLSPLGWGDVTIKYLSESATDPYTQYLNTIRHDSLLRHELGVIVPHDTIEDLGDTVISSPADGDILVYSDGTWNNRGSISGGTP